MKELMSPVVDVGSLSRLMGAFYLLFAQPGDAIPRLERQVIWDVFGNPFRPITLDPRWRTPTVTSLAQAAYDERRLPLGDIDAARLAVLPDAVEEADCAASELLAHLRSPGLHGRGCWALDLILGKS
jgi:hypothetical protein